MRKLTAIAAAIALSCTVSHAQMSVGGGWQATQLIRTNVASDGYRSYTYAWSNGWYAGVKSSGSLVLRGLSYEYSILYNYAAGTENDVLLIMDDPHYNAASAGQVFTEEHCISVPVAVRYSVKAARWLILSAYAGAGVDYCLSSKSYCTWPGVDGVNTWNVDHFGGDTNYNGYRRFDVSLLGGAGLTVFRRIRLEGGVSYGLADRSAGDGLLHRFTAHAGIAYIFK